MDRTIHLFEDSFINLNIELETVMISSFPNKLVIGEPCLDGYLAEKSFYFCIHELKQFFIAFCKSIMYVTFEKDENSGIVIARSQSEVYHWEGFEVSHFSEDGEQIERKFKLFKKNSDNSTFEICLTLHNAEVLIRVINDLILTAMCLRSEVKKIMEQFIDEINKKRSLVSFENKLAIALIVNKLGFQKNISYVVDMIYYYREIFTILSETNDLKQKMLHCFII